MRVRTCSVATAAVHDVSHGGGKVIRIGRLLARAPYTLQHQILEQA